MRLAASAWLAVSLGSEESLAAQLADWMGIPRKAWHVKAAVMMEDLEARAGETRQPAPYRESGMPSRLRRRREHDHLKNLEEEGEKPLDPINPPFRAGLGIRGRFWGFPFMMEVDSGHASGEA